MYNYTCTLVVIRSCYLSNLPTGRSIGWSMDAINFCTIFACVHKFVSMCGQFLQSVCDNRR